MATDVIEQTFLHTTKFPRSFILYNDMRHHYKSRNEPVATDSVYSDTPAINNGARCAQFFVGRDTLVCNEYPMKIDKEFVNTLEDNIYRQEPMDPSVPKLELVIMWLTYWGPLLLMTGKVNHYQHQNLSGQLYGTVKSRCKIVICHSGAPANTWYSCLEYLYYLLNHTSTKSLDWDTTMQSSSGETSDISIIVLFQFWEPVYYTCVNSSFPTIIFSWSNGSLIGVAKSVGNAMTFKVLVDGTQKNMFRSNVRSATILQHRILSCGRKGEMLQSFLSPNLKILCPPWLPGFHPRDLIRRTLLGFPQEDEHLFCMQIVKAIANHIDNLDKHPSKVKFLLKSQIVLTIGMNKNTPIGHQMLPNHQAT
jgi:hypothetical protein